jgi:hypothetical protein
MEGRMRRKKISRAKAQRKTSGFGNFFFAPLREKI